MIACTSVTHTLPPVIYTPDERAVLGVDGVNSNMLIHYIHNVLAQAIAALDIYPIFLIIDKSNIHNIDRMKQAFIDSGCQCIADIVVLPTQAAKRVSPLDNTLFAQWKQHIKQRGATHSSSLVRMMSDEWNRLTAADIKACYHHCRVYRDDDVYGDCPDPHSHQHHQA
jgi:hypothetical protein